MVIGLALTPTVVEQVGYVTGTGGDNLTGALIEISSFISFFGFFSVTLSVSVGATNTFILGNHNLIHWRWGDLSTIQERLKKPHNIFSKNRNLSIGRPIFPRFFGVKLY